MTRRSETLSARSEGGDRLVSSLEPLPRRPGRYELRVDGRSLAVLSLDDIERLELAPGRSVAGREERIADAAAALRTYDRALALLAFRARSSAELARALGRKGEERRHVERAIEKLTAQGLLDDAHFAQAFARARLVGAGHSRRRIQGELARRGVAREVGERAIETVLEEEEIDQHAVVEEVARRRLRALASLEPGVRRRRLHGFLARRGYDLDVIRAVMESLGEALRAPAGRAER